MSRQNRPPDHLQSLFEDPSRYSEIAEQYGSPEDCFYELRDEAKQSLDSFDQYLEFYRICMDQGPTNVVERFLDHNGVRILKNMVLRDSSAGRRYQVDSAAELHRRVEAFRGLGVEKVTPRAVVATILEFVFDSNDQEARLYEIASTLLSSPPGTATKTVELLTRIRFVAAAQTMDLSYPSFNRQITSWPHSSNMHRNTAR